MVEVKNERVQMLYRAIELKHDGVARITNVQGLWKISATGLSGVSPAKAWDMAVMLTELSEIADKLNKQNVCVTYGADTITDREQEQALIDSLVSKGELEDIINWITGR